MNRFEQIVAQVSFPPWQLIVGNDGPRSHVQVRDDSGVCNVTGVALPWGGRKWLLSDHMTETEIVKTCLKAVLSAVEHETLENFRYQGVTIFDPHIRVEDLVRLRASAPLDARVEQQEPERSDR